MSVSNHSGETPDWLNEAYMQKVLQNVFNDASLLVKKMSVGPGSSVGDNYICQVFRISLVIEQNKNEEVLSIIGKFNSQSRLFLEFCKKYFNLHEAEERFFEETLPELREMVKGRLAVTFGPKVYICDKEKKIILMEDLKSRGFILKPRHEFLDFDHCLKTVESHATFHATSYQLIQQKPELKKQYSNYLWGKKLTSMEWKFIDNTLTAFSENMEKWNLNEKQKEMIKKLRESIEVQGLEICQFSEDNFNVLLHGDCWKNNMMYKYDDNGKVQEVCLLDFQLVNYNSFAIDLQYFLSSSSTHDVRFNRIDEVLEFYHKCFCKVAPNVLTLQRVKDEFQSKNYLGFCMSMFMRPMVVAANGMDIDRIMDGEKDTSPYASEIYASEIKRILDFFSDIFD